MVKEQKIKTEACICPLCGNPKTTTLFSAESSSHKFFYIIECGKCKIAWTFPLPDDNDLQLHNFSSYYGKKATKFIGILQKIRNILMKKRARYYLSLFSKTKKQIKILDIGCAEGRLLNSLLEYGCECIGIEHHAYPAHRFIRKDKIKYFCDEIDSINLEEKSFDLIFMWHVFEHMDNPDMVMEKVAKLLTPEGCLIVAVPNFQSLESKVFKQKWFHLDTPWHKYHFSINTLYYLAEKKHLKICKITTFCLEQSIYGLIQSILNSIGFKKNELYELLKGEKPECKTRCLLLQVFLASLLLIPSLVISYFFALAGKGSVIKMILRPMKEEQNIDM